VTSLPSLTGKQVLGLLTGIVLYHEFTCPRRELISHEVDRQRARHPLLVVGFILVTAGHLTRWLPNRLDPYGGFGYPLLSKLKGR
jgi:hypothetical protein